MRLPEQKLWDRMRDNVNGREGVKLERIENMVGSGFPDVWSICRSVVTPIELKAVDVLPVRASTRLIPSGKGLDTEQRNWHLDWHQHGGFSLIVLSAGSGNTRMHFAVPGSEADKVNDWNAEDWKLGSFIAPHRTPEFWRMLRSLLGTKRIGE